MSYCTNCGSQLAAGARFCTSCGTPVDPAAGASTAQPEPAQPGAAQPGSQQHTAPAAQQQQPQHTAPAAQQQQPQQGYAHHEHAPAARTSTSAFASVPASDYVRDGLAVFLLLISMFMIWTYGSFTSTGSVAATRIDVILITLVSMFSVAIPYLWRSGVFGVAWGYRRTQQARLAANAPYIVLVLVYLILELVNRQGLGPAPAFGLAGAILAAQPRRAELGSAAADAAVDKNWSVAVLGFAGLAGILTVIQFIERMTLAPSVEWAGTLTTLLLGAASAALLVWTAVGISRGNDVLRLIGIGIGAAGLGMGLLALIPTVTVVSLVFHAFSPGLSIYFWLAFGALAASPSVARFCAGNQTQGHTGVLARTGMIANLAIIVLGLVVVVSALVLIANAAYGGFGIASNTVPWVVVIFLAVVGAVGGFVAKSALKQHTRQSYVLTAGYAAALFILGLVIVIMAATSYMVWNGTLGLLAAFVLPIALMLSMFGSASQREAFRSVGHGGHGGFTFVDQASARVQPERTTAENGYQPETTYQPAAQNVPGGSPEHHGVGTAVQVDEELAGILAESADPASPPARLYEIAAQFPAARPLIAG
ncbi:MAG TPA: zinc ribbon domain-containing protein, partial [Arthrobacter sp.]|nr:zinc ribbon domain-containing protein [Arthrobacter sp.]